MHCSFTSTVAGGTIRARGPGSTSFAQLLLTSAPGVLVVCGYTYIYNYTLQSKQVWTGLDFSVYGWHWDESQYSLV